MMETTQVGRIIDILKTYAKENGVIVRSTSDLSPLEEWLLVKIVREEDT